jgi:hypothetical protein
MLGILGRVMITTKDGEQVMDFYCREVWLHGLDMTSECAVLNLADDVWWLWPTFPGWSEKRAREWPHLLFSQ